MIQAFIGNDATSEQYHVFELTRQLPRFSMYLLVPFSAPEEPESYITFQIAERIQRVIFSFIEKFWWLMRDTRILAHMCKVKEMQLRKGYEWKHRSIYLRLLFNLFWFTAVFIRVKTCKQVTCKNTELFWAVNTRLLFLEIISKLVTLRKIFFTNNIPTSCQNSWNFNWITILCEF